MNNSYGRHIGSVTDVHGREVKVGTDCDAVTVGDFVLDADVMDDFMKLLMQADTEAREWAAANPPRTETDCKCSPYDPCPCEADGDDGLCACCRDGECDGSCAAPGAEAREAAEEAGGGGE